MIEALIEALIDPLHALHFLLPTGDSRSGRRSLIPNSSPFSRSTRFPFTYRFAARVPSDSKGSECQCGIHTAEAASALRSRKTQRAAKEVDANLTIFLAPTQRLGTPTRRHALGRLPTPPPLPENLLLRLHRKLPSVPPASTQEVSESENRPATRGTAHSEVQGDERGNERGNE